MDSKNNDTSPNKKYMWAKGRTSQGSSTQSPADSVIKSHVGLESGKSSPKSGSPKPTGSAHVKKSVNDPKAELPSTAGKTNEQSLLQSENKYPHPLENDNSGCLQKNESDGVWCGSTGTSSSLNQEDKKDKSNDEGIPKVWQPPEQYSTVDPRSAYLNVVTSDGQPFGLTPAAINHSLQPSMLSPQFRQNEQNFGIQVGSKVDPITGSVWPTEYPFQSISYGMPSRYQAIDIQPGPTYVMNNADPQEQKSYYGSQTSTIKTDNPLMKDSSLVVTYQPSHVFQSQPPSIYGIQQYVHDLGYGAQGLLIPKNLPEPIVPVLLPPNEVRLSPKHNQNNDKQAEMGIAYQPYVQQPYIRNHVQDNNRGYETVPLSNPNGIDSQNRGRSGKVYYNSDGSLKGYLLDGPSTSNEPMYMYNEQYQNYGGFSGGGPSRNSTYPSSKNAYVMWEGTQPNGFQYNVSVSPLPENVSRNISRDQQGYRNISPLPGRGNQRGSTRGIRGTPVNKSQQRPRPQVQSAPRGGNRGMSKTSPAYPKNTLITDIADIFQGSKSCRPGNSPKQGYNPNKTQHRTNERIGSGSPRTAVQTLFQKIDKEGKRNRQSPRPYIIQNEPMDEMRPGQFLPLVPERCMNESRWHSPRAYPTMNHCPMPPMPPMSPMPPMRPGSYHHFTYDGIPLDDNASPKPKVRRCSDISRRSSPASGSNSPRRNQLHFK